MASLATLAGRFPALAFLKRLAMAGCAFVKALRHPDAANWRVGASLICSFRPEQASLTQEELLLLRSLVEQSNRSAGPIIEIGTLLGLTTARMALWKAPGKRIITVDNYCWNPWGLSPEAQQALAGHVLYYLVQSGHVEQVAMGKEEFYRSYAGPAPALVFLDAVHQYLSTRADIAWARRVKAEIICGHDYAEKFPGVVRAVDEAGGPRRRAGTLWVL